MQRALKLEAGLNDIAVMRTTFEAMDLFPANDSIRADRYEILADSRANLIRFLSELCGIVRANPTDLPFAPPLDYSRFKACALEMMKRGVPGPSLNGMLKVTVFNRGNDPLYFLDWAGLPNVEAAREMPPRSFTLLFFTLVSESAGNAANYVDGATFDREIYRKYLALLFLAYASTDPMFYGFGRQ